MQQEGGMAADPVERMAAAQRTYGEHGGVNGSIEVSTTFTVLDAKTLPDIFSGRKGPSAARGGCYLYGRSWSPSVQVLGRQLAAMEGTEAAYAVSSGMAAISSALLGLCDSGDHVVSSSLVYGGSYAYLADFLPRKCGIEATFVDITDLAAVAAAFTPRTKVLFCETVANPTLAVADLPALARLAHERGAALVVDNTFMPLAVSPARWGADVVVHSLTKFVSGASDIIAGAVCGSAAFIEQLMSLHTGPLMLHGPTMDPKTASELTLRLPHLALRMAEHSRRAAAMAGMLQGLGAEVTYPGLASHPQHAVLQRLLNPGYGCGGLIGINMGSPPAAEALMERLQNKHGGWLMAVSLGYFDTLMSLSSASTSSELRDDHRAAIPAGYVRMSCGITGSLEQRLAQLREAYSFVTACRGVAPYRATKVQRAPNGVMVELLSWPSAGPHEDGEAAAAAAADELVGAPAAAALAAAAGADAGCRMVLGPRGSGGGWQAPALPHGRGESQPASSFTAALSGTRGCEPGTSSEGEVDRAGEGTGSPSPRAAGAAGKSRLSAGVDAAGRPVKVRRLDADTHIVYTPLA
ncbi:hypothetical protein HT031_006880 [Scenedesmus sp. PABB004]|nr:hypothetical protein HT031_006880 [Scenedesmus sp. PABB004]